MGGDVALFGLDADAGTLHTWLLDGSGQYHSWALPAHARWGSFCSGDSQAAGVHEANLHMLGVNRQYRQPARFSFSRPSLETSKDPPAVWKLALPFRRSP